MLALGMIAAPLSSVSAATLECVDGIDNDHDGLIDYPNDDDCSSSVDTLERPSIADLTVTLTDGQTYAQRDELLTYTLTIRNNLNNPYDVPVRVTFSNLTYLVDIPSSAEEVDSSTLRWPSVSLGAHEAKAFTITARVISHTPNNAGIVARAVVSTASATDQTIVSTGALPPPDISVTLTDGAVSAHPGEVLAYTVRLKNNSAYVANDVHVSAALPYLEEFVEADEGGTWDGRNIRWWKLQIPARGAVELHFRARVRTDAENGRLLQASVEALNAQATDTTTVGGAVMTASSSSASSAPTMSSGDSRVIFYMDSDRTEAIAGGMMNITLSVRNVGTATRDGIVVTQTYDPKAVSPAENAGAATVQPGKMTWNLPPLAGGETWQTTVPMAVAAGATAAQTQTTAVISGDGVDSVNAVRSVNLNILRELPATGAAFDAIMIVVAAIAAFGIAAAHRRAIRN